LYLCKWLNGKFKEQIRYNEENDQQQQQQQKKKRSTSKFQADRRSEVKRKFFQEILFVLKLPWGIDENR
jgi:hypothetical protein